MFCYCFQTVFFFEDKHILFQALVLKSVWKLAKSLLNSTIATTTVLALIFTLSHPVPLPLTPILLSSTRVAVCAVCVYSSSGELMMRCVGPVTSSKVLTWAPKLTKLTISKGDTPAQSSVNKRFTFFKVIRPSTISSVLHRQLFDPISHPIQHAEDGILFY